MHPMSGNAKRILIAAGNDDYAAELAVKESMEALVPAEFRQSAVEIVDGNAANAEAQLSSIRECLSSVQTPPFLDPVKFTWWKRVCFLPGGGRGGHVAEDVEEALKRFADTLAENPLPENQFLAITATRLLATSVFAKRLGPFAEIRDASVPARSKDRAAAALARLPALAKAENLVFEDGADRAFAAKTGPDARTMVSELAKMRAYIGGDGGKVTMEDVAEITSAGGDDLEIWALTDALASRNAGKVLETLRKFQGDSGWAIMVSTVAERWFRDLIAAKAGCGGDDWKARRNAAAAASFTMNELRIGRYRMLALREKLVSSQPAAEYVEMELLRSVMR